MQRPGASVATAAALAVSGLWGSPATLAGPPDDRTLDEIVVVGVPLSGSLPLDRWPASVLTIDAAAIAAPGNSTLDRALAKQFAGTSTLEAVGNPLQAGLSVRGFTASPLLGEPQGVVVLQGPMRTNEAFGDVVQWDLLPVFAISSVQVISGSNPVYGPNSIGGAVAIDMKNGFDSGGLALEAAAGSERTRSGVIQYGTQSGAWGFYAGVDALDEDGWRDHSPSRLQRGHADVTWQSGPHEAGATVTMARSRLTGNGAAPGDLLEERREAVFTHPDRTDSSLGAVTLRASLEVDRGLRISGGAYYRGLTRRTVNGDRAEFESCADFAGPVVGFDPPEDSICFGAEIEDDGVVDGVPAWLVDGSGDVIVAGDADGIDAVFNQTSTSTSGSGASAQVAWTSALANRDNVLVGGISFDEARTRYRSGADLATLGVDRGVTSLGTTIGNDEFVVALHSDTNTLGAFVTDTLSLTRDVHATATLRWNRTRVRMRDQAGEALDGDHRYESVSPAAGVAWSPGPAITLYGSFAENTRPPTPAELSCADPARPCRFPNAFLADPPLRDVRARTFEAGLRGKWAFAAGDAAYSLAVFRTSSEDDIVFVSAGQLVGTGYFDNAGLTRRRGVDVRAWGTVRNLSFHAGYALVDATFESPLTILSPHHPGADDEGAILVRPGASIPGIPRHAFRAGLEYSVTPALRIGGHVVGATGSPLRGDEANLERPLDGYVRFDLDATLRLGRVEIFGALRNVLDASYETFGLYGEAQELGYDDPRFLSPAAPRALLVGIRASYGRGD